MEQKKNKCQSCGDFTDVIRYNGNYSCKRCLGMDKSGVARDRIVNNIEGKHNDRIRGNRKKHR